MNVGEVGDWEINHCSWLSLHISSHAQLPKAISQIPNRSLCHPCTILCIITTTVFFSREFSIISSCKRQLQW